MDAAADGLTVAEIEGRARHLADFAGRDQELVHRRDGIGVDGQMRVHDAWPLASPRRFQKL